MPSQLRVYFKRTSNSINTAAEPPLKERFGTGLIVPNSCRSARPESFLDVHKLDAEVSKTSDVSLLSIDAITREICFSNVMFYEILVSPLIRL